MPAEFEAEVRNGLRALRAEVTSLEKAQVRANAETRKYGKDASDAFRSGAGAARAHAREVDGIGKSVKDLGQGLQRMGGPLAEIVGRLGGGIGMGGGLSRVAAGAAIAGIALKAFNAIVDRTTERVTAAAAVTHAMTRALEAADKAGKKSADAGLGQAGGRRRLLAAGGKYAVQDAQAIAATGVVGAEDAENGVATIYNRHGVGGKSDRAIRMAKELAATGIPFASAAEQVASLPSAVLNDEQAARRATSRIYGKLTNLAPGRSADHAFGSALANVASDGPEAQLLRTSERVGGIRTQIRGVQEAAAISGGEASARDDLAAAVAPLATAMSNAFATSSEQLVELKLIRDALEKKVTDAQVRGSLVDFLTAKASLFLADQKYRKAQLAVGEGSAAVPFNP